MDESRVNGVPQVCLTTPPQELVVLFDSLLELEPDARLEDYYLSEDEASAAGGDDVFGRWDLFGLRQDLTQLEKRREREAGASVSCPSSPCSPVFTHMVAGGYSLPTFTTTSPPNLANPLTPTTTNTTTHSHNQRQVTSPRSPECGSDRRKRRQRRSSGSVLKDGWMDKRGKINRAFKRRWFRLVKDGSSLCLVYFRSPDSTQERGRIPLTGAFVGASNEDDREMIIRCTRHDRLYALRCDTSDEIQAWKSLIDGDGDG